MSTEWSINKYEPEFNIKGQTARPCGCGIVVK